MDEAKIKNIVKRKLASLSITTATLLLLTSCSSKNTNNESCLANRNKQFCLDSTERDEALEKEINRQVKSIPGIDLVDKSKIKVEQYKGTILIWAPRLTGKDNYIRYKFVAIVRQMIDNYKKLNPEVNVEIREFKDAEIYNKYKTAVLRGLGPDLMITYTDMVAYLAANSLISPIDLKNLVKTDGNSEMIMRMKYNDKVYALPYFLDVQGMCYNKKYISSFPKNLEELIKLSKQGNLVGIKSTFMSTLWGLASYQNEGMSTDKDSLRLLNWSKWINKLKNIELNNDIFLVQDDETLNANFMSEQMKIITCQSSSIPIFWNKLGKEHVGFAPLPQVNNKIARPLLRPISIVMSSVMSMNQKKLSLSILNYMISVDQQQKMIFDWKSILPINNALNYNKKVFPLQYTLQEISKDSLNLSLSDRYFLMKNYTKIEQIYTMSLRDELKEKAGEDQIQNMYIKFNSEKK